ncbi:MAG: hypothetical protein K1000chlam3_01576 [Chlamydiae bacterium]|nr:hypothetical protein [Chlamydiota bacterium]
MSAVPTTLVRTWSILAQRMHAPLLSKVSLYDLSDGLINVLLALECFQQATTRREHTAMIERGLGYWSYSIGNLRESCFPNIERIAYRFFPPTRQEIGENIFLHTASPQDKSRAIQNAIGQALPSLSQMIRSVYGGAILSILSAADHWNQGINERGDILWNTGIRFFYQERPEETNQFIRKVYSGFHQLTELPMSSDFNLAREVFDMSSDFNLAREVFGMSSNAQAKVSAVFHAIKDLLTYRFGTSYGSPVNAIPDCTYLEEKLYWQSEAVFKIHRNLTDFSSFELLRGEAIPPIQGFRIRFGKLSDNIAVPAFPFIIHLHNPTTNTTFIRNDFMDIPRNLTVEQAAPYIRNYQIRIGVEERDTTSQRRPGMWNEDVWISLMTARSLMNSMYSFNFRKAAVSLISIGSSSNSSSCVSCIPNVGHAALLIENCFQGNHLMKRIHLVKNESSSGTIRVDQIDEINNIRCKSITWVMDAEKVERVFAGISGQHVRFNLIGIFGRDNCLTWAVRKLHELGLPIPSAWRFWPDRYLSEIFPSANVTETS